jgi:hypothetical protein
MAETKRRRSPGGVATTERLIEPSKVRAPDPEKFRRARQYSDTAEQNKRFEENYGKSSIDGRTIHHFHRKGEFVIGIIGEAQGETYGPSSFPFELHTICNGQGGEYQSFEPPRMIRLPGNRRLAIAVRKADCLYQRIKVTYKGKLHAKVGGHYEKVYLVEEAPLSKEPATPAGRALVEKAVADAKAGKDGRP